MQCDLFISGVATGIYDDLGQPSGTSLTYISGWLVANVGKLNTLINTCYSGVSGCIEPELGLEETSIYREVFFNQYYSRKASENLSAIATDSWIEIKDEESSIRRASKADVAKSYLTLRDSSWSNLNNLVTSYRLNKAVPQQVVGDDTIPGQFVARIVR